MAEIQVTAVYDPLKMWVPSFEEMKCTVNFTSLKGAVRTEALLCFAEYDPLRMVVEEVGVISDWILATGFWNDDGKWDDNSNWID